MRPSWDEYFMDLARKAATRATCDRKKVGAVIVRDKTILSTGYNGSIAGWHHCDDVGHMMEEGHCIATIHAETNAIINAARHGHSIDNATCYVTANPCWNCFKHLVNSGIKSIIYDELYRTNRSFDVAEKLGIELKQLTSQD